MSFWDASALIPLILIEEESDRIRRLFARERSDLVHWWGTPVECASALRRNAEHWEWDTARIQTARDGIADLLADSYEVPPSPDLRARAERIVSIHGLRAGDALQLAAALTWAGEPPRGARFISLDARLALAAMREGFEVLPEADTVHEAPPVSA